MKHVLFVIAVLVCLAGAFYGTYLMMQDIPTPMVILAAVLAAAWTIADYRRSL